MTFQGIKELLVLGVVYLTLVKVSLSSEIRDDAKSEWLDPNTKIEFDAAEVPHVGLLNRLYWIEKNERSTSRNYTLWEEADLYLLEWPGNVTLFDLDNLKVKWGRHRAKFVEDLCGMEHTGIEMRAYAYKYVYLTWGPYRLTKTYTIPLSVPRSLFNYYSLATLSRRYSYEENALNTVEVFDIEFVYDALLLAHPSGIIRVSGLEMGWAEVSQEPRRPLEYSVSKGVHGPVDKIVVQKCCLKTVFCPFGNMVVAYLENSLPHILYTSYDGGITFKRLTSSVDGFGQLRTVLSFPELSTLLLVHGKDNEVKLQYAFVSPFSDQWSYPKQLKGATQSIAIQGFIQSARLGMETSFVIWDDCSVWYSPDMGGNLTRSLLYFHKKIPISGNQTSKSHQIVSKHCGLGVNSTMAYGTNGRFGILDSNNVFLFGVDAKTNLSQLIALKVDMTLMIPGTELSVVPYFDIGEQPRLYYPPKFLEPPKFLDLGKKYERRLGMRLLLKNVYPSDFIYMFHDEIANLHGKAKIFALEKCQTSTLQVNNSISQRKKFYLVSSSGYLNFTINFKSKSRSLKQLKFGPSFITKYLKVSLLPRSIDMVEQEPPQYWIKYRIIVKPLTLSALNKVFRLVFYTRQSLRCTAQPRIPVYIKVVDVKEAMHSELPSDEDLSQETYLKSVTAGAVEYLAGKKEQTKGNGETIKVDACPLAKEVKISKDE